VECCGLEILHSYGIDPCEDFSRGHTATYNSIAKRISHLSTCKRTAPKSGRPSINARHGHSLTVNKHLATNVLADMRKGIQLHQKRALRNTGRDK
jgi:hypothetical protein